MAIDARIPLETKTLDLAGGADNYFKNYNQAQSLGLQKKVIDRQDKSLAIQDQLNQENLVHAKFKNLSEREQDVNTSLIKAAAEVKGFVDTNDDKGIENYLMKRIDALNAAHIDPNHTIQELNNFQTDPEAFKKNVEASVNYGRTLRILKEDKTIDNKLKEAQANYYNNKANRPDASDATLKGGATGALISRLMQENPALTFSDALYQVQTGNRQGLFTHDGTVDNLPGVLQSKENLKKVEARGTAEGKIEGTSRINAEINLPKAIDQADYLIKTIDKLKSHPGKSDLVGAKNVFSGAVTSIFGKDPISGTDASDFKALLDQVKGSQFLEAYNTLKGTGSITEIEGQKGEKAISRMQTAQSEKAFDEASDEFKNIVDQGLKREIQKVYGGKNPQQIFQQSESKNTTSTPSNSGFKFLGYE